jgi:ubiquinone/menaquinone biosynthesis C-methylase UbiE
MPRRGLRGHTRSLLEPITLPPGASALNLGCRSGETIDLLSELVGRSGRVVGVARNQTAAASARALARHRGWGNVEIIHRDFSDTRLPSASFDLVHVRRLLVETSAPERVVEEIARLVRPDGWVAILEPDAALAAGHPAHLDRYVARRLPHLLASAGMERIIVEACGPLSRPKGPREGVGERWLPISYFLARARRPAFAG